jgi:hypothetical protein
LDNQNTINLIHNGNKGENPRIKDPVWGTIQKTLKGFILEGHLDISEIKM